jgi:hypothetical protein
MSGAEYAAQPHQRTAVLSATACDFSSPIGVYGFIDSTPSPWLVGRTDSAVPQYGPMLPGNVYYVNVRNWSKNALTCNAGENCGMYMDFYLK